MTATRHQFGRDSSRLDSSAAVAGASAAVAGASAAGDSAKT